MSKTFSELGIHAELQENLAKLQISVPTNVQEKTIPLILLKKEDVVVLAKTGTGKTAAFGLPLLQLIDAESTKIQALILAPTRELGQQIHNNLVSFATENQKSTIASICGGIPIKHQIELLKETIHTVLATPGRLVDLVNREAIIIKDINYYVLAEAAALVSALK